MVDDEVLDTEFAEVESILNTRTICPNSNDPDDYEALTPNYLLLQREIDIGPPGQFEDDDIYDCRFVQVKALASHFWKQWSKNNGPVCRNGLSGATGSGMRW